MQHKGQSLYSYRILCKELQSFVEPVVLAFHVLRENKSNNVLTFSRIKFYLISDSLGQDVFVERSGEVTLQQFVVVDGLCDDSSHKFEVAEMVGVDMGEVVDGVGHSVPGTCLE